MQGMMTSSVCFKLRQIVNPTRRALSTDVLKSANESSVGTRVQVAKFCCTKTEKKKLFWTENEVEKLVQSRKIKDEWTKTSKKVGRSMSAVSHSLCQ